MNQAELNFDGDTYEPDFDEERLGKQSRKVYDLMVDGEWRTLGEIESATGAPQASISARLRDFRKPRFGGFTVERRRRGDPKDGLFEYQLNGAKES